MPRRDSSRAPLFCEMVENAAADGAAADHAKIDLLHRAREQW